MDGCSIHPKTSTNGGQQANSQAQPNQAQDDQDQDDFVSLLFTEMSPDEKDVVHVVLLSARDADSVYVTPRYRIRSRHTIYEGMENGWFGSPTGECAV